MGALPVVGALYDAVTLEDPAYGGVGRGAEGILGLEDETLEPATAAEVGAFLKAPISTFPTGL